MSKYTYGIMHLPIKRYLKWWLDKMASLQEFIVGFSNENPATLINCLKAPFISFKLGGRTEQYTTSGKNLLQVTSDNIVSYSSSYNNYTLQNNVLTSTGNTLIGLKVKVDANSNYTAQVYANFSSGTNRLRVREYSQEPTDWDTNFIIQSGDIGLNNNEKGSVSITTSSTTSWLLYVIYTNSSGLNASNMMLETGSTATDYEPYTRRNTKS